MRFVSEELWSRPGKAELVHFHSELEQIVETFTLSLGLRDSVSPYVARTVSCSHNGENTTHIPCRLTNTAYVSGCNSIAFSRLPVRSSSNAVFSMIGMLKVS